MIGLPSFLLELALPAVFAFFLVAICLELRKKPSWAGLFAVLMLAGVVCLLGVRYSGQLRNRGYLQSLRPEAVRRVSVGRQRITDPQAIARVVRALNEIDWFSNNHGGTGERQWLVLDLHGGGRRMFVVSKYLREEGAVLELGRSGPGGIEFGDAFSRTLPSVLAEAGINLEAEKKTTRR